MSTRYRYHTKVKKVEHMHRMARAWKVGDEVHTEMEDQGWSVLLEGSWEWLHIGTEKPDLEVGQKVIVTIEPV
jgi:ribosomal protein L21E